MYPLERIIIDVLLRFFSHEQLNTFLGSPQNVAIIVGSLIAISGALLGAFLLLRQMSMTSDAISHTILLGIVVVFLLMVYVFRVEADLSSPWLIVGAAAAGVATVVLTEAIQRSGLIRQDAALGLAFPLLFAIAIILIARFADNVHLDEDAVLVGEIGVAWADTNSHCYENCATITITPDDPRAEVRRRCTNCRAEGISPRDPDAVFQETCGNCGTYSPAEAYRAGLLEEPPLLVFWPQSITVMGVMTLLTAGVIGLLYKEFKLSTFDEALAGALGFRPAVLHYTLMVLVSLVAVSAFDAVGAVLVVAFFILPPAAAYLLTDRLSLMLLIGPAIGALGAVWGYELARGSLLGLIEIGDILAGLNRLFDLGLDTEWNTSISASMVMVLFLLFLLAWLASPRHGLIAAALRRESQRRRFADQVVLGHIYNHEDTARAGDELALHTLHEHLRWSRRRTDFVLTRLRALNWVRVEADQVSLTERGRQQVERFYSENLPAHLHPSARGV